MTDAVIDTTPDLPPYDAKAPRGNELPAPEAPKAELTKEDLEVVGKPPEDAKPAEDAAAVKPPEGDKPKEGEEERPRGEDGKFLPKAPMIPKARFDEVNNKARAKVAALEEQVRTLTTKLGMQDGQVPDTAALETTLDEKSAEYSKLIADGDLDKATGVLREINKLNRQIGLAEATALTSAHTREVQNVTTLEGLVDLYKANYPVFDSEHAEYKQEYVDFVATLQGKFERSGSSPAEALREAVELAVGKFRLDDEPAAPPVKADPAAERKAAGAKAALEAAKGQPPALKGGIDSDKAGMGKIDVKTLTYEEFDALPESTKKRLRGDNM